MLSTCFSYIYLELFVAKRRNRKRKPRTKQDDETSRTEDKEMEDKQEVESGAEEAAAELPILEDEGTCINFYFSIFSAVSTFSYNNNKFKVL